MKPAASRVVLLAVSLAVALAVRDVATQGTQYATVKLPTSVAFAVTNASVQTTGSPSSTRVEFSDAILRNNRAVLIGVRADGDFVPPSGTAIPASRVSWTVAGAVNGTGFAGTLSKSAYTDLFQANEDATSGRVDVTWRLAAPAVTPLRAGAHTLTMRWRVQSINP